MTPPHESRRRILDGHDIFSHWFAETNCIVSLKRPKINERGRDWPIFKTKFVWRLRRNEPTFISGKKLRLLFLVYSPEPGHGHGHVRKANSVDTSPRFVTDEYSRYRERFMVKARSDVPHQPGLFFTHAKMHPDRKFSILLHLTQVWTSLKACTDRARNSQ